MKFLSTVRVLAVFGLQMLRLRRKRRHLQRISLSDQFLYRTLALVSAMAVLSLLIGYSAADLVHS